MFFNLALTFYLQADYKDCEIKYAEEFEAYWVNVYLQTLGYFLDHIERMDEFWFWYGQRIYYFDTPSKMDRIHWIYENNHVNQDKTVTGYVPCGNWI